MIKRVASLSILVLCLFSLGACVVAPVGPGYGYGWRWVPGHRV
jgi:hypothetical protein